MPFTPAHPAIILPLLKKARTSALGLIVGSMAPDFEYFFKMKVNSQYSHTLGGVLYFDLPVSFLLSWLFIRFVKVNLVANLPVFLQRRLQPMTLLDYRQVLVKRWFVFVCSALLGSLSHLFWDGFTHNDTFFVRNLSFYHGSYVPYEGVKYPLWYALQHISSAIGLSILAIYVLLLPTRSGTLYRPNVVYWITVLLVMVIVVVVRFQVVPQDLKEGNVIVCSISGLCCGLVLAGMINFNNLPREAKQQDG
jgi:hypothetical protein